MRRERAASRGRPDDAAWRARQRRGALSVSGAVNVRAPSATVIVKRRRLTRLSALSCVRDSWNLTITLAVSGAANVFGPSLSVRLFEPTFTFRALTSLILPLLSAGATNR